jgi:hypothetical protein
MTEPNQYEKAVFVSYAGGSESEQTVAELEKAFAERGLQLIHDKKDLAYKGSFKDFGQRLGQGQCVILVISDPYLRSEHCMFELVEVEKNQQLRERVFPIVLADARIEKAIDRLTYIRYWDEQIEQLDQALRETDRLTDLAGITADLDQYARIRANFDHLTELLHDMNALTPAHHAQNGYSDLMNAVERTLASHPAAQTASKNKARSGQKPGRDAETPQTSRSASAPTPKPASVASPDPIPPAKSMPKRNRLSPAMTNTLIAGLFVLIAALCTANSTIIAALIPILANLGNQPTPATAIAATAIPSTATSLPPTQVPTFQPALSGGPTVPPPPECPRAEIYFKLILTTGVDQIKCPNANNMINLQYAEVQGLSPLIGQALGPAIPSDSQCRWEWHTNKISTPQTLQSPQGDCGFSINLDETVTQIYLKLISAPGRPYFVINLPR